MRAGSTALPSPGALEFLLTREGAWGRMRKDRSQSFYGKERNMLLATTAEIYGKQLKTIGLVSGSTVQTVNALRDIGAGLKTLVGGELKKYNEMMSSARALATERMVEEAQKMGADAVVSVRYSSASIMQGAAEVMVYGTAVRFTGE